ncbi:heat-inducible transcription repressor HrcA [candidate division KSB1 bacterium RBG_16_48_16]|nr:MAG: heat-inducible transcription repressor HrcA [candidate division KSB1 bacterium RBG_16_48_16]
MGIEQLTERERLVFLSIVHSFVQTAEPVGSRYLAKKYNLNISPATIRNVMTDLEEKGLINQPHTSAGRIPTDYGYRQYVDSISDTTKLTSDERHQIFLQLKQFSEDLSTISEKASQILGEISSQLGVVLAPRFNKGRIQKLELVSLSDNKLLLILGIQAGLVKTIIIEIDQKVPPGLLQATVELLNERLYGLSLEELQTSMENRFKDVDERYKSILRAISYHTDKIVENRREFYLAGTRNVILNPEFETREKVDRILELIDRKDILIKVLTEQQSDGISIVIGEENREELMKNCSLITTTYSMQGITGTIGVIGPTRMQYDKVIALVHFMSETLSHFINK